MAHRTNEQRLADLRLLDPATESSTTFAIGGPDAFIARVYEGLQSYTTAHGLTLANAGAVGDLAGQTIYVTVVGPAGRLIDYVLAQPALVKLATETVEFKQASQTVDDPITEVTRYFREALRAEANALRTAPPVAHARVEWSKWNGNDLGLLTVFRRAEAPEYLAVVISAAPGGKTEISVGYPARADEPAYQTRDGWNALSQTARRYLDGHLAALSHRSAPPPSSTGVGAA